MILLLPFFFVNLVVKSFGLYNVEYLYPIQNRYKRYLNSISVAYKRVLSCDMFGSEIVDHYF